MNREYRRTLLEAEIVGQPQLVGRGLNLDGGADGSVVDRLAPLQCLLQR